MPDGMWAQVPTMQGGTCSSGTEMVEMAWYRAEIGDTVAVRDLVASTCQHCLPALYAAPSMVSRLAEAALLAGAFGLLSRTLRALYGVEVRIAGMAGDGSASAFLCDEGGSGLEVALDLHALEGTDRIRVAQTWSGHILDAVRRRSA